MRLVKPHFSCVNNVYKVLLFYGGVPEWFNGAVPKTAVFTGLVSSNLTPSAFATPKLCFTKRWRASPFWRGFGVINPPKILCITRL